MSVVVESEFTHIEEYAGELASPIVAALNVLQRDDIKVTLEHPEEIGNDCYNGGVGFVSIESDSDPHLWVKLPFNISAAIAYLANIGEVAVDDNGRVSLLPIALQEGE